MHWAPLRIPLQCTSLSNSGKNETPPDYSILHAIPCNEEVNQSSWYQRNQSWILNWVLEGRLLGKQPPEAERFDDNQSSKKVKIGLPDSVGTIAQDGLIPMEMSEARHVHLHNMLSMQLHNMTMFPGAPSSQFYNLAAMQLHENRLS